MKATPRFKKPAQTRINKNSIEQVVVSTVHFDRGLYHTCVFAVKNDQLDTRHPLVESWSTSGREADRSHRTRCKEMNPRHPDYGCISGVYKPISYG